MEPYLYFFNRHTMVCLPQDSDVSKYNSIDDVTGKFDTIEADHYYTFDRELNSVWDK